MKTEKSLFGALSGIVRLLPLHRQHCGVRSRSCLHQAGDAFFEAASRIGFDYARFTFWRTDLLGELKLATYSHSFSNFPGSWEASYWEQKMFHFDPVLFAAQPKPDIVPIHYGTWRQALKDSLAGTSDESLKQQYRSVFALAGQYGVNDGIYFTFGEESHAIFISCANQGGGELEVAESAWRGLYATAVLMDSIIENTLSCEFCIKAVTVDGDHGLSLTEKQLKVLQLFAGNSSATAKSVAREMCVEPETINFHLKQIRKVFRQPRASGHALAKIARELRLMH